MYIQQREISITRHDVIFIPLLRTGLGLPTFGHGDAIKFTRQPPALKKSPINRRDLKIVHICSLITPDPSTFERSMVCFARHIHKVLLGQVQQSCPKRKCLLRTMTTGPYFCFARDAVAFFWVESVVLQNFLTLADSITRPFYACQFELLTKVKGGQYEMHTFWNKDFACTKAKCFLIRTLAHFGKDQDHKGQIMWIRHAHESRASPLVRILCQTRMRKCQH